MFFLTCEPRDFTKGRIKRSWKEWGARTKVAFDRSMLCACRETVVSLYTKLLHANDNSKVYIIIKSGFKMSLGTAQEHRLHFSSMPFNLTMQSTHYREELR